MTVNVDSSGDALTAGHGVTLQVGGSGVIKLESGVTVRTNNATLHFIGAVQTGGGSVTADAGTGALTIDKTVTDLGTTALSLSGNTVTLSNTVNVAGADGHLEQRRDESDGCEQYHGGSDQPDDRQDAGPQRRRHARYLRQQRQYHAHEQGSEPFRDGGHHGRNRGRELLQF